jgi:hypothetical protein
MSSLFSDRDLGAPKKGRADLPMLKGTPKQVPWATAVRAAKLQDCDTLLRQWRLLIERHKDAGRSEAVERERAGYAAALDRLGAMERQVTCRWWLDRRENTAEELLTGGDAKPGSGE